jgi:polar amino acid transport system substrate-binding protein
MEVLAKPGRLTPEEYELVKSHSVMGEKILEPMSLGNIKRISRMVRHHHESYDGAGYPDGLKGEGIPLGARILALADSFDTMVSDRSYRRALSFNDAIVELHRCCGTQFDPQLVDSFLRAQSEAKSSKIRI